MKKYGYNDGVPMGEEKNSEKLIKWLSNDPEAIQVKDDKQFGKLSAALQRFGYFTTDKPNLIQVQQGVSEYRKEIFRRN